MKPIAIITGATGGLGEAFAYELARRHYDLLLTGRNTIRLTTIKQKLEAQFEVQVETETADLTVAQDLQRLITTIQRLHYIEILVNNAGFGNHQNFFESDFDDQKQLLQIHVDATTQLVHKVVPLMTKNHKGFIINVSSLAAFLPSAESYFYCASKAFMVAFSECMSIDLRQKGIITQVLCPGFVDTGFHQHPNTSKHIDHQWLWMSPQAVVNRSLKSLYKQKVLCIPGLMNRIIYHLVRHIPKSLYYQLVAKQQIKNEPSFSPAFA